MPAGGKDETAIEVQGKEEEPVDLDSSLIWAIRYLECETVESMLSEGKRLTLYHRGPAWVDPHAASDSGLRAPVRWFIRGGALPAGRRGGLRPVVRLGGWSLGHTSACALSRASGPAAGVTQRYLDCGLHEVAQLVKTGVHPV